jgi:hypothetical protein
VLALGNWHKHTCERAARYAHLEVLKWLKDQGCPWGPYTFSSAIRSGDREVLTWVREQGCPWDEFCFPAAEDDETRRWLVREGCPMPAAENDETRRWLLCHDNKPLLLCPSQLSITTCFKTSRLALGVYPLAARAVVDLSEE